MKSQELYQYWLHSKQVHPYIKEELIQIQNQEEEIQERFAQSLSFGTAGIRGIMGAGTNRLNVYTVRKVSQGLAQWIEKQGQIAKQKGVVIAYDSRFHSLEFAQAAAGVLAYNGVKVYLFNKICPTPVLSYAVRHFQAVAGLMVTASHNPPNYNGIKVYGSDGAQISTTLTSEISYWINQITDELLIQVTNLEEAKNKGLLVSIREEFNEFYHKKVTALALQASEQNKLFRVVYSPLHGTGRHSIEYILRQQGFQHVFVVPEQGDPDPNFSTVPSPNPEDPNSFDLAIAYANQQRADLILVTDPDADRVGIAVRDDQNQFVILTGNQVGALLLHYILSQRSLRGELPLNGIMVKSIVTSELGEAIASAFGVMTQHTLTGFKYIAEYIKRWEITGEREFLFGYEESYGYLIGSFCRDKDAIQACLILAELGAYYHTKGFSIYQVLQQIYQQFGYFQEDQITITLKGLEGGRQIDQIMKRLRRNSPIQIAGFRVDMMKDYQQGLDELPPANVVKFFLEDGSWFAVRPSGTEPKMKCYIGVKGSSFEEAKEKRMKMKRDLENWFGL